MPTALPPIETMDPEPSVLQVRTMDPEIYAAMRVECAVENVTLATLIKAMWLAYSERKYDGKLPTAHTRAQRSSKKTS